MPVTLRVFAFFAFLVAPAAADDTLGTLIRWYLDDTSVNRREDFLLQIEKLTNAHRDPTGAAKKVMAAIRRGDHYRHDREPRFGTKGPVPRFSMLRPRIVSLDGVAGRYATLRLPGDYDPQRRYPLVVDIGPFAMPPAADAVHVVLNLRAHKQAYDYAWAAEALTMSVIAYAFDKVSLDPDRVVLRADGSRAALGWYVVLHNPDRFAGYVLARGLWRQGMPLARNAHLHQGLMIGPRKANPFVEPFYRALRAAGRGHMIVRAPSSGRRDGQLVPHIKQWRRRAVRQPHAKTIYLAATRNTRIRSRWLSMAPRARSLRVEKIQPRWQYRAMQRPGTIKATIGKDNLVEIEYKKLAGFHLYLSPDVFDPEKPLRIRINKQKVPTSTYFHFELQDLLDDYRERRDPGLLYARRIDFKAR